MSQDVAACTHDESRLDSPLGKPSTAARILCATDLTDRSSAAERRASLLAQQTDAEVLFVHALTPVLSRRVRRLNFARAHVQLLSRVDRAMAHAPQCANVSVRHGTPVQVITQAAGEWQPDLIVMACPRLRTFDLILGTTAERVIRATQRPLLIVNAAEHGNYQDLLLATDISKVPVHVARTLKSMNIAGCSEIFEEDKTGNDKVGF
jgi:nucleotide-binding universal stress UspA family protein